LSVYGVPPHRASNKPELPPLHDGIKEVSNKA